MISTAEWIVILSLLGSAVAIILCAPYLVTAPLSREKRFYMIVLSIMWFGVLLLAFFFRAYIDIAFAIGIVFFTAALSTQLLLLRRIDYYLEDLLHELMAIVIISLSMILLEVFWYWGIDQLFPSLVLRLGAVGISLFSLGLLGVLAKASYYRWTVLAFVIILIVKWLTVPLWGVWFMIMSLLYAVLVGYVAHWQIATTRAEQVYAENTNPTIIWLGLLAVATVLVLVF